MKKKNITIMIILSILIIFLLLILLIKNNNKDEVEYDYTNKVFHYGGYIENSAYQQTYIFMKDGTYYNFSNQYDEASSLRSLKGAWERNGNKIDIDLEYAIFYDGGELVQTEDMAYFGVRRKNYSIVKKNYQEVANLDFEIKKGQPGDKYMDYLDINSSTYYPIYEFETEEELYIKLEEMYGEVFTMLIDDSVEIKEDNNSKE